MIDLKNLSKSYAKMTRRSEIFTLYACYIFVKITIVKFAIIK